jgi:hypothetical protein
MNQMECKQSFCLGVDFMSESVAAIMDRKMAMAKFQSTEQHAGAIGFVRWLNLLSEIRTVPG